MNIIVCMQSSFAFARIEAKLKTYEYINFTVYEKNVTNLQDLDEGIDLFDVDIFVIDERLNDSELMNNRAKGVTDKVFNFNTSFDDFFVGFENQLQLNQELEKEDSIDKKLEYTNQQKEQKIIYKDRIVEKEIFKTAYTSIPTKTIVVSSLWSGSGSSTFAMNLARAIAERGISVAYIEYPKQKPFMFDYLSIPLKESKRKKEYQDKAQIFKDKTRQVETWNDNNIQWHVNDSRLEPITEYTTEELFRFVFSINASIRIVDISNNLDDPEIHSFLYECDELFVCIEGDPIRMDWSSQINSHGKIAEKQRTEYKVLDFLEHIRKAENIDYQYVYMKYTKTIPNNIFLKALGDKKPICYFPVIPYEDLLFSMWESKFIYDDERYHELIDSSFKNTLARIIPKSYISLSKPTENGINKIKNIFKKEK